MLIKCLLLKHLTYEVKSLCNGTHSGHYILFLYICKITLILKTYLRGGERGEKKEGGKKKEKQLQLLWEAWFPIARLLII